MAEFTDDDKRILDILRTAFERGTDTSPLKDPWQEMFRRESSVYGPRSAMAAELLRGFSGSWASSYTYAYGSTVRPSGAKVGGDLQGVDEQSTAASPPKGVSNRLGQRGFPEINFVPYNHRTNAFGDKGPSLLGHPISFEFVGPTLKSEYCDWVWTVQKGIGAYGGDVLEMSVSYEGGAAVSTTLLEGYNLPDFTIGDLNEPDGGLYLAIIETGANPGSLPLGAVEMAPNVKYAETFQYELFRVVEANGTTLELHPNKTLSDYFDLPPAQVRTVRAVMLIKPYVTRLAAIPSTDRQSASPAGKNGREQTFMVISPEVSAAPDTYPPYDGPGVGANNWIEGVFTGKTEPGSDAAVGEPDLYMGRQALPIPTPRFETWGELEKSGAALPSVGVGAWLVNMPDTTPFGVGPQPKIVKVFQVERDDDLPELTFGAPSRCLGYFPVYRFNASSITLARVPEIDLTTGSIVYGPGPYIQSVSATQNVTLSMTVHDPVSSLWEGIFDYDAVEACRITNLIDPRWVERFEKQVGNVLVIPQPPGSTAGRPDRAIFDTRTGFGAPIKEAADPGSLLDLGFRMVIFPAREDAGGYAVPDWDRPITSREVVIDPSVDEKQYIDIDYSAGKVRLSHPPPDLANIAVGEGDLIPNGIVGLTQNNPRGEVVLFAACVPYSMEEGQLGGGPRVQLQEKPSGPRYDVYSRPFMARIDSSTTTYIPTPPFIGPTTFPPNLVEIVLDRIWQGPMTGYFEICEGVEESTSLGLWAYSKVIQRVVGSRTVSVLGGLTCLASAGDPAASPGEIRTVIARHDARFFLKNLGTPGHDDRWYSDTAYGHARRPQSMSIQGMVAEATFDGVKLQPLPSYSLLRRPWGMLLPSRSPISVAFPSNPNPQRSYFSEMGLLSGLKYEVPFGHSLAPAPGGRFWIDEFGPSIDLACDDPSPTWHGVLSNQSQPSDTFGVVDGDAVRLEAKFAISYEPFGGGTPEITMFIGFVQWAGGGANTPTVGNILQGPGVLGPGYGVTGIWLDTTVSSQFQLWTQGPSGFNLTPYPVDGNFLPGTVFRGPFTFVAEFTPNPLPTAPFARALKTAFYDAEGRLLGSALGTDANLLPVGTQGLYMCAGISQTLGAPANYLRMYRLSVAGDTDQKDLPQL